MPSVTVRKRKASGDNYFAMMELPLRLRNSGITGLPKRRFVRSTETGDEKIAKSLGRAYAVEWQALIDSALGTLDTGKMTVYFRRLARALKLPEAKSYEELLPALGGKDRGEIQTVPLADGRTVDLDAETGEPVKDTATVLAEVRISGGPRFAAKLDEWLKQSEVTAKTKDMQRSDILEFAKRFPHVESVTLAAVKEWTMELRADKLTVKTVQRKLSALRGYWSHLRSLNRAPAGPSPFNSDDLDMPSTKGRKKKGRVKREDRREAFQPAAVVKLMVAARRDGDGELADLIDVARWTGCRIEEVCSMTVESVKLAAEVPHVAVNAGKTDAAIRFIPIHDKLAPVLRRLIGKRKDGFLFADLSENKYGDRSNAIGKRFGHLKSGKPFEFGPQYVFHSIRKTVASLLKAAQIPEFVAADILGHEIATMSYGVYAKESPLEVKAKAIASLDYSPKGSPTRTGRRG